MTEPPTPPDAWPTPEGTTLLPEHETVVVQSSPPAGPPPDRRIGAGMLLALGAIALVGVGVLIAWLLIHKNHPQTGTTIVVTTNPVTTTATTTSATTTSATTTGATTTAATTTAPTTTAPAPPQSVTVPDVQGQKEAAAAQALGQAGLLASLAFVPGSDPLGTVTGQAKPSGTTLPYHSHVQINVSRGPNDNPLQQVPNVIGRSLQDAVSTMQGAHLRLIYLKYPVSSQAQAGKIVQQSPLGGGQAPQNAQVLVFLGALQRR